MTNQIADRAKDDVPSDLQVERKAWSRPTLIVRSIEDVTHGQKASTNTDTFNNKDNS